MPKPIIINLGGKNLKLIYNISSLDALSVKVRAGKGHHPLYSNSDDLMEILNEFLAINQKNFLFASKLLIWSGLCGAVVGTDKVEPDISFEELGELVASMEYDELYQFTDKCLTAFWEGNGINLEKIKEVEGKEVEKKK